MEQSSETALSSSGPALHTSDASVPSHSASSVSSSSKRKYSEVGDDDDGGENNPDPSKKVKTVERFAFIPVKVYGHKCLGILFTAGSIRGRGTVVFCVVDLHDARKLWALKTSWLDLQRVDRMTEVLDRLENRARHPNLIIPLKYVSFNII
jgi:hypothetical protein